MCVGSCFCVSRRSIGLDGSDSSISSFISHLHGGMREDNWSCFTHGDTHELVQERQRWPTGHFHRNPFLQMYPFVERFWMVVGGYYGTWTRTPTFAHRIYTEKTGGVLASKVYHMHVCSLEKWTKRAIIRILTLSLIICCSQKKGIETHFRRHFIYTIGWQHRQHFVFLLRLESLEVAHFSFIVFNSRIILV